MLGSTVKISMSNYAMLSLAEVQVFGSIEPKVNAGSYASHLRVVGDTDAFANEQSDLLIYPNPSSEMIHISGATNGEAIYIYDISGALVLKSMVNDIDITDLEQGMYYLYQENTGIASFIKK